LNYSPKFLSTVTANLSDRGKSSYKPAEQAITYVSRIANDNIFSSFSGYWLQKHQSQRYIFGVFWMQGILFLYTN